MLSVILNKKDDFTYDDIEAFLTDQFGTFDNFFFPENNEFGTKMDGILFLFFWSLLTYRIEIAKIFWRLGSVNVIFCI